MRIHLDASSVEILLALVVGGLIAMAGCFIGAMAAGREPDEDA